jgi:hypothetical protein
VAEDRARDGEVQRPELDGREQHHVDGLDAAHPPTLASDRFAEMANPTRREIEALVGPATPQFAYQLRARVRQLIEDLPQDDPVRRFGEEQMELLDRLGHASSKAADGGFESRSRLGWEQLPSSAPADAPLPRR